MDGFSQVGGEVGISGGGSYYLGEYNTKHFEKNQSYIAGLYRYNLNDRFALRLNVRLSKIKGSSEFLADKGFPEEFNYKVKDFSGVVEFDFRSFMVRKVEKSSWWTPYIFTGIGYLKAGEESSISMPVDGLKFNLYRQFSCGVSAKRILFIIKTGFLLQG